MASSKLGAFHRFAGIMPVLLCAAPAQAAPGGFDTTFGNAGTITTDIAAGIDIGRAVALQPDGRIVVVGTSTGTTTTSASLARYLPNGTLDASFDADGKTSLALGAHGGSINALAIQADGRIVLAGEVSNGTDRDFLILRYRIDGTLDATFGNAGRAQTPIDAGDEGVKAVAIQADGRIVAVGYSRSGSGSKRLALARYLANGALDPSFGVGGKTTEPVGTGDATANAVAIDGSGRIVVAGSAHNGGDDDFSIVRFTSDGTLDTTFGSNGVVIDNLGRLRYHEVANAIALQADGLIVIGGGSAPATNTGGYEVGRDFTLARYQPDGSRDFNFAGGALVTRLAYYDDVVNALAIQPDGRLLALGTVDNEGGNPSFALVRYLTDGREDATFANSGRLIDGIGYGNALALQPDAKIIAAGSNGVDFSVRRFLARDDVNDGISEGWALTPGSFSFTDVTDVPAGSVQTSNPITVTGLDEDVRVPATVCGGELAVNGNVYTKGPIHVQNGDRISVRHTAATTPGTVTNTVLRIGGVPSAANPSLLLGGVVSDTFSSTTTGTNAGTAPQGCQPVIMDTGGTVPTSPAEGGSSGGSTGGGSSGGGSTASASGVSAGGGGGGTTGPSSLVLLVLAGWLGGRLRRGCIPR